MNPLHWLPPLLVAVGSLHAGTDADPGWHLKPFVAARLGYDDNVFLQDRSPVIIAGAVPDRAASWVARTSGGFTTNWQPSPAFHVDARYSVEAVRYEAFSSERHDDHRLDLGLGGKKDVWSYQLKGSLFLVDGADRSPLYGHIGGGPAIGGAAVRARRDQTDTKIGGQITRRFARGLLRAVGDESSQNFTNHHSSAPGYANYVDRSEWSAGLDAGYDVRRNLTVLAGVRGGVQRQADLLGVSHNYSNTLTRFLVGVEGRPRDNLTLHLLAGPDVRHYGPGVASTFDRTRTSRYGEAAATWKLDADDSLALTVKDYLWLSSAGRGAYQSTTGNLQWRHALNEHWNSAFAADVQAGNNRAYSLPPSRRLDWIYTATAGITRAFGANTQLDLELSREWSESAVAGKPGREYTHWLATVGLRHTF